MHSGIADGKSIDHQGGRPDRREPLQQGRKHRRSRKALAVGNRQKIVDQVSGARRCWSEQVRPLRQRCPETAQQRASLLQSDQGISRIDLKVARQRRTIDALERNMVDAGSIIGGTRETARTKHVEAGDRKPLGTREGRRLFTVAPRVAGAGVEQDADGREVDGPARPLDRIGTTACRELAPAIDAARGKMAPAAVIRNDEIGIGRARDIGHIIGDGLEPALVEHKMRRAAVGDPALDHAAAFAHRGGGPKPGELRRG